jgi:hypothetical protein
MGKMCDEIAVAYLRQCSDIYFDKFKNTQNNPCLGGISIRNLWNMSPLQYH